jgi:hypothetical protein
MKRTDFITELAAELACSDCKAEVRVREGVKLLRARVIHDADCSWYRRYQAREVAGRIPRRTFVTHRGPSERDPEAAQDERQAS